MRRLRRFVVRPWREQVLTAEAAVWLAAAEALLAVLPFRRIASRLGTTMDGGTFKAQPPDARHQGRARRVGHAVARAARHVPWPARCLAQAMAAKAMLWRRGIPSTLHFGMALAGAPVGPRMQAHAWLTVGTIGVVGVAAARGFTVLARFTHEAADARPLQ
jgi:hypothetical protein